MYVLFPLLLAFTPQTLVSPPPLGRPSAERSGAIIFECDFGRDWDKDYDDWPDGWARRHGKGYPAYLQIQTVQEPGANSVGFLEMRMDGGAAVVYGPSIEVDCFHAFYVGAMVRASDLKHNHVFLSVTFFDANRRRLEVVYSEKIRNTVGWRNLRLGPLTPASPDAVSAVIGLHVEPTDWEDLQGVVQWDDVWMSRSPRLTLSANRRLPIYIQAGDIKVRCDVSGHDPTQSHVSFRLEDAEGTILDQTQRPLRFTSVPTGMRGLRDESRRAMEGDVEWNPPISGPGFYRIVASIQGDDNRAYQGELTLAVIEPSSSEGKGIFGWSLPGGGQPLAAVDLAYLLSQSGVRYVKYPMWFDPESDPARAAETVQLCERLSLFGIQVVGLLHDPPPAIRQQIPQTDLRASEVFGAPPEVWAPSLERVAMRMATQVRWWQLGRDEDMSFIGYPDLHDRIELVRQRMNRVGFDVQLGFGWSWMYPYPVPHGDGRREPAWRFLNLSMSPPMTRAELATYLTSSPPTDAAQWIALRPLPRSAYNHQTRILDLVHRMIEARLLNATAVFVPEAFHTENGLMNEDASPGDLFLPWRTTAIHLAGGQYRGSIQFPGKSQNAVFEREKDSVIIVWNDTPRTERIYMGRDTRQVDLWGRAIRPAWIGRDQVFEIGPYPTFLVGADSDIVRWRQGCELVKPNIPSVFGQKHPSGFAFKNDTASGISVRARVVGPEVWQIEPPTVQFTLGEGQIHHHDFQIGLPYNATSGRHPLEIDVEVQTTTRTETFSVYRDVDVGMGDIYMLVSTQLNAQGELEVHQTFVNETDTRVSFSCRLITPGRRVEKSEIIGLGRGREEYVYILPDGEELIGQTLWIRAQENGSGIRTLNQNFEAKRK